MVADQYVTAEKPLYIVWIKAITIIHIELSTFVLI